MIKIIHRINTIKGLREIPNKYGVEIDVRASGKDLILNHEPFEGGDLLKDYLKEYKHSFIVFNIKEAGIEQTVIDLAKSFGIKDYFLLDVEFPYLYSASRKGVRDIAVRYSEDESIVTAEKYKNMVDWVWIDTNTMLPLDEKVKSTLSHYKTCLVSPDRWGRSKDIKAYREEMSRLGFNLDAVVVGLRHVALWE